MVKRTVKKKVVQRRKPLAMPRAYGISGTTYQKVGGGKQYKPSKTAP